MTHVILAVSYLSDMLQREMEVEAKLLNIKISISQETEPLGTGRDPAVLLHQERSIDPSASSWSIGTSPRSSSGR